MFENKVDNINKIIKKYNNKMNPPITDLHKPAKEFNYSPEQVQLMVQLQDAWNAQLEDASELIGDIVNDHTIQQVFASLLTKSNSEYISEFIPHDTCRPINYQPTMYPMNF